MSLALLALLAGVLVPARVALVRSAAAPSVTVNASTDEPDANPGDGVCDTGVPNADGAPGCTLRAALQEVNGSPVDTVLFGVPATDPGVVDGVVTIAPTTALPVLAAPVVLDGSTQPGFVDDPIVAVDGSGAGGDLLDLTVGSSTVRALVLHDAPDEAINIRDGGGTRILGTWIGVLPDGTTPATGADDAIAIRGGANGTVIGGAGAGEGNLIAGSGGDGVYVLADDVVLEGNRIGVVADGAPGAVARDGIRLDGADRAVVRGNTIATVGGAGITVVGAAVDDAIVGNSLVGNAGLGIDLGADGVTANDPGDLDGGPNGRLNVPVVTRATPETVTFELDQTAGDVLVEVFTNPSGGDPSGSGEGELLVGSTTVAHPGGVASHTVTGLTGIGDGDDVSLTATRTAGAVLGATSEFSVTQPADDHLAVVNDSGDAPDETPGDGACTTGDTNVEGDPACTLRAAIEESNATGDIDRIEFAIPTTDPAHDAVTGVWTVVVGSDLPAVTGATLVDGTTQPGAASNPLVGSGAAVGVGGVPLAQVRRPAIALDDPSGAGPEIGLEIAADGVTVRGLAIARFPDAVGGGNANLVVRGADVTVEGVVLGPDPVDPVATTGGPYTVGDNLLLHPTASGTLRDSVLAWAGGAAVRSAGPLGGAWTLSGLEVTGHGGTPVVAPATITLDGGSGHRLSRLHVHGNAGDALRDGGGSTDVRITDVSLADNGGHGVRLRGTDVTVSGAVVTGNGGDGVHVTSTADDVVVSGNELADNGGLGIDLGGDGVTANDVLDADPGPNGSLNTPVFVRATPGGVTVELDVPAGDVLLEVYANPTHGPDPSGSGEGEVLVHAEVVTHPGGGSVAYDLTIAGLTIGDVLSATASRVVAGAPVATSEFSPAALVAEPTPLDTGAGQRVVADATGNGHTGQPFGAMTSAAQVPGRIGGALDLDGVDDRIVVHGLDVRGDALTLSAWVRPDGLDGDPAVLAEALGLGAADVSWRLALTSGAPGAAAGSADVRTAAGTATATGPSDVAAGAWIHLAATYDGAAITLWRDGRVVATAPHTGALRPDPDVPLVVGAATAAGDRPFDGAVDEVRVSDVARSAAWLAAEHAIQSDPTAAITVGAAQGAASEPWRTTTAQARSGSQALEAPRDVFSAWLTRDGLDQAGIEVTAWWRVSGLSGSELGQGLRSGDAGGPGPVRQDEVGLDGTAGFDLGRVDGRRTRVVAPPIGQTPPEDDWQRVTVRIDPTGQLSATADGVDVPTSGTVAGGVAPSGSLGFRVGRLDGLSRWWIDDLRVRRLVTPEPVATLRRGELVP